MPMHLLGVVAAVARGVKMGCKPKLLPQQVAHGRKLLEQGEDRRDMVRLIGQYLSSLRKLDHVIMLPAGFKTQLGASRLLIPLGMRALGMTRQIRDGGL